MLGVAHLRYTSALASGKSSLPADQVVVGFQSRLRHHSADLHVIGGLRHNQGPTDDVGVCRFIESCPPYKLVRWAVNRSNFIKNTLKIQSWFDSNDTSPCSLGS